MAKYVCNSAFTLIEGNKRTPFTAGQSVSEIRYRRLNGVSRRRFSIIESTRGYKRWIEDEHDYLIELYYEYADVDNGSVDKVVDEFLAVYSDRSWGSVNSRAWGILGLDTQCPKIGLATYSQEIVDKLHEVDPERFPATSTDEARITGKLENLISQILSEA
jgi:hypothetical protein